MQSALELRDPDLQGRDVAQLFKQHRRRSGRRGFCKCYGLALRVCKCYWLALHSGRCKNYWLALHRGFCRSHCLPLHPQRLTAWRQLNAAQLGYMVL